MNTTSTIDVWRPMPRTEVYEFHAEASLQEKIYYILNTCLAASFACRLLLGKPKLNISPLFYTVLTLLIARKALAILSGFYIYEAIRIDKSALKRIEQRAYSNLKKSGLKYRQITLIKMNTSYSASMIVLKEMQSNPVWALHAVGVKDAIEPDIETIAKTNAALKINTLLVNGPQVGKSGGFPSRYHLGAAYEAGLQYLEKAVKAKKIIMHGYSFGGNTLAEVALNHDFTFGKKNNIDYLFISDRTFSDLQSIASHRTCCLAGFFLRLVGMQLDGLSGAKKLSELGIKQLIIQGKDESDKTIPDCVSLAKALLDNKVEENKTFLVSNDIEHGKELPAPIQEILKKEINQFTFSNTST